MPKNTRAFKKQILIYKKEAGNTKYAIPVTMWFDGENASYTAEDYTHFRINIKGDSLKDVMDQLDALIMDKHVIEWKPFIEIEFEGRAFTCAPDEDGLEASYMNVVDMKLTTTLIEIGTEPNGKKWYRTVKAMLRDRDWMAPYSREDGMRLRGWKENKDHDKQVLRTTIPDTPENREALRLLTDNFEKLRIALFDIIAPAKIQKTLSHALSNSLLLTAGSKKK